MLHRYCLRITCALLGVGFLVGCGDSASSDTGTQKSVVSPQAGTGKLRTQEQESVSNSSAETTAVVPWFVDVTAETGIDFVHQTGTSPEKPFPAANGSGVAVVDFDLDGRDDLYFATGTAFPVDLTRPGPTNRAYRNLGGWNFEEVTGDCQLGFNGYMVRSIRWLSGCFRWISSSYF